MLCDESLSVPSQLSHSFRISLAKTLHSKLDSNCHHIAIVWIDLICLFGWHELKNLFLLLSCDFDTPCLLNPANLLLFTLVKR